MTGKKIFILNSNSLVTKETQKFLSDNDCNICLIPELYDLKKQMKEGKPDLIILEVIALTSAVVEVTEIIQNKPELRDVPNIAVLNNATRNLVLSLARMGYRDILVKPVNKEVLLETIDKAVAPFKDKSFRISDKPTKDGFTVVELIEYFNATNSMEIDGLIDHLIKKEIKKVVIDLNRVSLVDSSGIGILVVCKRKLDLVSGAFRIANAKNHVKKTFSMLHIDKMIEMVDSVEG